MKGLECRLIEYMEVICDEKNVVFEVYCLFCDGASRACLRG